MSLPVLYFLLSLILVFGVSVIGGLVPLWGRLTHRGMQVTLEFRGRDHGQHLPV